MKLLLYDELVPFYHLIDPLEDHADEADEFGAALRNAVPEAKTLLELGSGAGHGAHHVKRSFVHTTLVDLSEAMLARSRVLNPDCEHLRGDMRDFRSNRTYDCVLIHDAISYITTREDLAATFRTAYEHLRPGGAALLVPDCLKETFQEHHEDHSGDDGSRSVRALAWSWDPDPSDDTQVTDFAFLLREGGQVRALHEQHVFGLFDEQTWVGTLREVGFEVEVIRRPLPPGFEGTAYTEDMFLARK